MISSLAAWAVATALHFGLMARATRRWLPTDSSVDDRIFAAVLGGIASLSIVLHLVAITVGLQPWSGIAGLALWHAAIARFARRTERAPAPMPAFDVIAIAVFTGIVVSWIGISAASPAVLGPDAAHYHVPHAVNLSRGASPFDLPATPHLYPMAGSVLAAWFIVPLGNPLIVDLAMAMPFLLLAAAINLIFRCVTGLSGTAWSSWLTLALFATPMFRTSALGSADLWFAAGFVAMVAVVTALFARRAIAARDVVALGAAAGLLAGSKATGLPAAVLIVAAASVAIAAGRVAGIRMHWEPGWRAGAVVSVAVGIAAGGVWLIRNWLQFGSPLAPAGLSIGGLTIFDGEAFQRSKYLSVLAEMDTSSFHLWPRAKFFIGEWFGPWFLAALFPIVLFVADLALRWRRSHDDARVWARMWVLIATVGVGGVLVWMLIGAPWTGLERSRGLTLRYALPVVALLALLSFAGLFPMGARWYAHRAWQAPVRFGLILVSLALFARSLTSGLAVPGLDLQAFAAAATVVLLAARFGARSAGIGRALTAAGAIAVVAWTTLHVGDRDRAARQLADVRFDSEFTAGPSSESAAPGWRDMFVAVVATERRAGQTCEARRFFTLTRFDEPLALQPPAFTSTVFHAARDVAANRAAGPIGRCDYVITTPAVAETDKGQALAAALAGGVPLRIVAATRDFRVLGVGEN